MKRLNLMAAIALLAAGTLLGGCGGTNNVGTLGNFVIALNGFAAHIGSDFYLKVVDTGSNATVGLANPTAIATDGFSVTIPDIISSSRNYRIDFWVDVNDDGVLDRSPAGTPAGVDESWRLTGTGGSSGLAMTFTYNTTWQDVTPF